MKTERASIPEVVSQLAEDCASLFKQRENAVNCCTFPARFTDIERLDERVDAAVDALRTTDEEGWRAAVEGLDLQGGGEIFTAAVLAFEDGSAEPLTTSRIDVLLGALEKPGQALRPLVAALEWIDRTRVPAVMARLATEPSPLARAVRIRSLAVLGSSGFAEVREALETGSKSVIAAACEAAVLMGERRLLPWVELHLEADDVQIQVCAGMASVFLGSRRAIDVLRKIATETKGPLADLAATILFRSREPGEALIMHEELFRPDQPTRAAVLSAGATGIPELVPFLIATLDCDTLSRLAAEGFCCITGADVSVLSGEVPQNARTGPTEDPADENTDLDPDEGKRWPDRAKVERWWRENSQPFQPMTKYLAGTVVNDASLRNKLKGAPQNLRACAAQLLALGGLPLFDVRAPAFRQSQRLQGGVWR